MSQPRSRWCGREGKEAPQVPHSLEAAAVEITHSERCQKEVYLPVNLLVNQNVSDPGEVGLMQVWNQITAYLGPPNSHSLHLCVS